MDSVTRRTREYWPTASNALGFRYRRLIGSGHNIASIHDILTNTDAIL